MIPDIDKAIKAMPKETWFTVEDVGGGRHVAAVWVALCRMDTTQYHHEGWVLVGNQSNTQFIWRKAQ